MEWILVTTLPIQTLVEVRQILQYYSVRWMIAVLFRTWKSGCRIQQRRFEHLDRWLPCMALYWIVAWRVLMLCRLGRSCPEMDCEVLFEPAEWQSVWVVTRQGPLPQEPPPLGVMIRLVAQLGGYVNRPNRVDPPGPQTLWLGLQRMHDLAWAWNTFGPGSHRGSQRCVEQRGLRPQTPGICRFGPMAWSGDPCPVTRDPGHRPRVTSHACAARLSCFWPKAENPMNWSPARGMCDFLGTFCVLHCILFHLAPSPAIEGASGKGCFHFLYPPNGCRPTLLSVLVLRTAHETSYRGEFTARTPSGEPAAIFRSGYSRNQASHGIDPLILVQLFCGFTAGWFRSLWGRTSSSLNSSPVLSMARMIISSLRAVATTATFFRWFWPPTICS